MASSSTVAEHQTESKKSQDSLQNKKLQLHTCPFKLKRSFGFNPNVPLINLTTENRTMIVYACSHVSMMYNYFTKDMFPLHGHKSAVETLSISNDGKWLLTANFEDECAVIVWDTEVRKPVRVLFQPHESNHITVARISPNAKYIVTVGNEKFQKVHFWLWTYGREKPDGTIEASDIIPDRIKEAVFHNEFSDQFILTTDHSILLFTWNNNSLSYYSPSIRGKFRRFDIFNASCFVSKTNDAITVTSNGFLLVWSSTYSSEFSVKDAVPKKEHIKSVRMQTTSITVILNYESMVVTGNAHGRITFYDHDLKLLYWCQNPVIGAIKSISFDLVSKLFGPTSTYSDSDLLCGSEEGMEEFEGEMEDQIAYYRYVEKEKYKQNSCCSDEEDPSYLVTNLEHVPKVYYDKMCNVGSKEEVIQGDSVCMATDATISRKKFIVRNCFVSTSKGFITLLDISNLKCYFIAQPLGTSITCLDTHLENPFFVTGNLEGVVNIYNYEKNCLITTKKMPPLPNFQNLLDKQVTNDNIIYVTCPQTHEALTSVMVLKYAPTSDLLVAGMENGALWMLHPLTLELLDHFPYKHSSHAIKCITFTMCSTYMAYCDDALTVAVFKKNQDQSENATNMWNFVGKCHSHYQPIRTLLFGPFIIGTNAPLLFSVGEERDLVEYDLQHSGPYPEPGLKIAHIHQIEARAIPLHFDWYPQLGVETFIVISNSEYKYRLLNDVTKKIRGTFLGPTFGAPVQRFKILPERNHRIYMIFVTEKEIGLQLLPLDGNPYKILAVIGHARKVIDFAVSCCGEKLFTIGVNDPCVLMWKIQYSSVDIMKRIGGEGLSPFYGLLKGGKNGWLLSEMRDLFYYAQILQQGESTLATRIVTDTVSITQIPNLMRAVGYFPSNEELENMMSEISYREYAETGRLIEDITFEEFVQLYINHRLPFGYSMEQIKQAFTTFCQRDSARKDEDLILTREQFVDILFGKSPKQLPEEEKKLYGEPLTLEEAHTYLRLLLPPEENIAEAHLTDSQKQRTSMDFNFLPARISYKDFVTDILGVEVSEKTRADNHEETT